MRKLVVISIIAVFVCVGFVACKKAPPETGPIKVGAIINLTGPASTWGQYHAKGHQDYFRYVNEKKGGVGGREIKLTVVDHAYKVDESNKFVKKFCAQDKMDMLATWDAGAGLQAKPIIQKYKTPCINYSTCLLYTSPSPRDRS